MSFNVCRFVYITPQDTELFYSLSHQKKILPYPFAVMSTKHPFALITADLFSIAAALSFQEYQINEIT